MSGCTDRQGPALRKLTVYRGEEKPAAILWDLSTVTEKRGVVGLALKGMVWLPNWMELKALRGLGDGSGWVNKRDFKQNNSLKTQRVRENTVCSRN